MKKLSILGDSLSTFELAIPKGHISFYDSFNAKITGITKPEDTWWGRLVKENYYELLVNNSYSGSRVSRIPDWGIYPSGCSEERILKLQKDDIKPDMIIVYLGTNDWGYGVPMVHDEIPECGFEYAYDKMLSLIKTHFPESEVYCCTLTPCCFAKYPDAPIQYALAGMHMEWYNDVIVDMTKKYGYKLIDLYKMPPYSAIDGAHADYEGMKTICDNMLYFINNSRGK